MSDKTRALSFFVLALLLLASYGPAAPSSSVARAQAVFQATSCSAMIGSAGLNRPNVRCGYLVVPENRQLPDSPSIKVPVAVFKAPGPNPAPDPLVYVVGGPGGETILSHGPTMAAKGLPAFVGNRDYILVNQRGTLLAKPSLNCPANATLQSCRAHLVKEGTDPGAYNVVEDAADIADLGAALGYKQVDLYGNSFGSLVTLQAMRDHPEGIRAVVLDGTLTPNYDPYTERIPRVWRAMQQIFKDCAASPSCNGKYPHLAQTFTSLLARLQQHPATVRICSTVQKTCSNGTLSGVDLWNGLAQYLDDHTVLPFVSQPLLAPLVPRMITNMARGNFSDVVTYLETIGWDRPSTQNGLMALSMVCSFDQSRSSAAKITAGAKVLPASIRSKVVANQVNGPAQCTAWHVPSIAAVNHTYFRSSIPALLFSGRYDPFGTPAQTQVLATKLGNAYFVPLPSGHHPIEAGGCPDTITRAFLSDPNQKPDTSCVAKMTAHWK